MHNVTLLFFFVPFQLSKFRKLKAKYGGAPGLMCDNIRPVQPLYKRKVYSVVYRDEWMKSNS